MLVRLDSFDHYSTSQIEEKWTQLYDTTGGSGTVGITAAAGRNGSAAMTFTTPSGVSYGSCTPCALVVPAHKTYILGFALKTSGPGAWASNLGGRSYYPWAGATSLNPRGHSVLCHFRMHNHTHLAVVPEANGCLSFWKGDFVSQTIRLGFADFGLQWGRTYYIEIKLHCDSVTGYIEMRVNGDVWFRFDGNTAFDPPSDTIPETVNEIVFGKNTKGLGSLGVDAGVTTWAFDDMYIANGDSSNPKSPLVDFWGDHRIDYRTVTAPGNYAQWIPTVTGEENWDMVDDNPHDGASTFNYTNVPGDRDSFVTEDAVLTGYPIDAMQPIYAARRIEGGPSSMRPFVRHGGTDYDGEARDNTTDFSFWMDIWEQLTVSGESPVPISSAVFNALEVGYEKVI